MHSYVGLPLFYLCNDNQACQNVKTLSTSLHVTLTNETCEVVDNHQSEDGDVTLPVPHVNKELNFDYALGSVTPPSVPFMQGSRFLCIS